MKSRYPLFLCLCAGFLGFDLFAAADDSTERTRAELQARFEEAWKQFGGRLQVEGQSESERALLARKRAFFRQLQTERAADCWVAALVSDEPRIEARFETWRGLADFLGEHDALVEVWTQPEHGAEEARRLTASEVAALRNAPFEQPTFITATFRDPENGTIKNLRVEWGLRAAEQSAAAEAAYARYREMQGALRHALGSRDARGRITPSSQWTAFAAAAREGLPITLPPRPAGESNLFLAVEYEVDRHGTPTNAIRFYRENDIERAIVRDSEGRSSQVLRLRSDSAVREASGFRVRPGADSLEPAPSPVLGQESVELRVKHSSEADPRRWNLVEFGEPELVRQSALAQFSLINAHLERQRKALAVKKSKLDLVAEPVIAALNIGGGLAGAGFPYGEAVRLAYNLITPKYIADVPTVKEMRELFALLAAKRRDEKLSRKLGHFLSEEDIKALEAAARQLSEAEVDEFARSIADSDLEAMVFLARMRRIDARVTNFLNILTSAAKVSGEAETGLLREIFNNSYASLNGEWSIKNSLAAVLGQQLLTPRQGVSLEDLVRGRGPAKAWAQYFDFSVDLRALVNTIGRIPRHGFAEKELYKPLPYALHLGDLAAYEVRIFGFPLFIFYKRGLIKADAKAFAEDYAYGIDGAKILAHFRTREEMDAEIRAGRMLPIGYVKVPDGRGGWKDTNLAVFAHRIPNGRHKGKMVIVIYGLKAYADHSQVMERELQRLRQFEQALQEGGVIERIIEPNGGAHSASLEPRLHVGDAAVRERYSELLARLLEEQRARRRAEWGLSTNGVGKAGERLISVDRYFSTFVYRDRQGSAFEVTLIPSLAGVRRSAEKAERAREIEAARRAGLQQHGVIFLNSVLAGNGAREIGPLLTNQQGGIRGAGVRTSAAEIEEVFAAIHKLPFAERARLHENQYAATAVELELNGAKQPVFLTVEFPIGPEISRTRTNSVTGEREALEFSGGQLRNIVTPHRRVEISYDESGAETASRIYAQATLIEEARTIRIWPRGTDPYAPRAAKLRINYVTGELRLETYGTFPEPITIVDDLYVTTNRYDELGSLASATIFDNGRNEPDFDRAMATKLIAPLFGRERFTLTARRLPSGEMELQKRDVLKQLDRTAVLDRRGRKIREQWAEANGQTSSVAEFDYREDFLHALVPASSRMRGASGRITSQSTTLTYNAARRILRANVTDYTGASTTNTWDYRWLAPIQIENTLRITTNTYDRAETSISGATMTRTSGEIITHFRGEFEAGQGRVWRTNFYTPSIITGIELDLLDGFGRLTARRVGALNSSFRYDADGVLTQVMQAASLPMGEFQRHESAFRWTNGFRNALVRDSARGEFRALTDPLGRTVIDEMREFPGLDLRGEISYDGASDRVLHARQLHNASERAVRVPQPPVASTNGTWLLPVLVRPAWGLASTQSFVLGDPLAWPISTVVEDGSTIHVTARAPGGAVRVSEVRARDGRTVSRAEATGATSQDRFSCDLIHRYAVSPWNIATLVEQQAFVQGTDVLLFSQSGNERLYYDVANPFAVPLFTMDASGRRGDAIFLNGAFHSNVVRVITGHSTNENGTITESVEIGGPFFRNTMRQVHDRAGRLLEEQKGRVASAVSWSNAIARATLASTVHFAYAPGGLLEQTSDRGRTLVFSTNAPGIAVNQDGHRNFITGIQVNHDGRALRRVHSPRVLESNFYLPGRTNNWTAWTATEFAPDGSELFQSEIIHDATGRESISRTIKTDLQGKPAVKIVYDIGPALPGELTPVDVTSASNTITLRTTTTNGSDTEFLYWYIQGTSEAAWSFSDARGRVVRLTNGEPDFANAVIAPWPLQGGHILWLPDAVMPEQALVVRAPPYLVESGAVLAVSVRDLERAGLDFERLQGARGVVTTSNSVALQVSPLFALRGEGPRMRRRDERSFAHDVIPHSSGLTTYITAEAGRTEGEIHGAERLIATTTFNDLPVLATYSVRGKANMIVVDHTADPPRPLYAIWPREGRFLEHYKVARGQGAEVYSVVRGFELPRAEVFDPRSLPDEIFPSTMAYGRDYEVKFHPARGRGWLGEALAALENRVVANMFRFAGHQALPILHGTNSSGAFVPQFNFDSIQHAAAQARDISELPTLAASILAAREVPWGQNVPEPSPLSNDWAAIGFALNKLHLKQPTGLIPTAPDTAVERYVDTEKEAELIILAAKVGELALARDLLQFYWQKSQGGQTPLHASYDAIAGTAMTTDLAYQRPVHARRTAGAQLAIANAAFILGFETANDQWITLGRNLLALVLERFRAPRLHSGAPRGISEYEYLPVRRAYGVTLWPDAELYSLRNNARAAILLKRLSRLADRFADRAWRFAVLEALREQETWLRETALREVERGGIAPSGWLTLQDINSETTALVPERWTAAEDWLAFVEAQHELGLPAEQIHQALDRVARVHGVSVSGAWGLDWSLATLRADAISADLTATFTRLARQSGHRSAAHFGFAQLARMRQGDSFPAVLTASRPQRALQSGQGFALHPRLDGTRWPATFGPLKELRTIEQPAWQTSNAPPQIRTIPVAQVWPRQRTDMTVFVLITAGVYIAILGSALFWWSFRRLRRRKHAGVFPDPLVPDPVLQLAEERWARRVLGVRTPAGAERTRFSNAPVEANFLMQLRAIYKLIIEWRRQENGWAEDDRRIVEDAHDDWLNGLDEYACALGLYMRWVIKAGAKDGFDKTDVLLESEDSNHIWSRLVMFCSEYYWGILTLLKNYNALVLQDDKANLYGQMSQLLNAMGMQQRAEPFDAGALFDFPADRSAMDLLVVQQPGRTLDQVFVEASRRLKIPYLHLVRIVERYKEFKRREKPDPVHPYLIEFAKILPHFLLMGLGALIWYNQGLGDSPIVPYLGSMLAQLALSPLSLTWVLPLFASMALGVAAHFVRIYRFDAPMLAREKTEMFLDATLTSLFAKRHSVMPRAKSGRWWNPDLYERAGWGLRAVGYLGLAFTLLSLDTPSFATFLVVKGIFAMLVLAEVAAIALPLAATAFSKFTQDWVASHTACGRVVRFINKLNITVTRPASPIWLSIKYHTQPSVPTGGFWAMTQAVLFYFAFGAVFFFAGGYLCQQILSLWFMDTYLNASNWKLFFGGLLFWNTMYLLRYGLFLLFTGIASALVTFPIKTVFALLALAHLIVVLFAAPLRVDFTAYPALTYSLALIGLILMAFEAPILRFITTAATRRRGAPNPATTAAALGVVYMSGDDLSHQKLTPELLMDRWSILRDSLGSKTISTLFEAIENPSDDQLRQSFEELYAAEKQADVTLWHPSQLHAAGETPRFKPELGLNIETSDAAQARRLLTVWHLRRWLVSMMSTAGHSQDTAINLVDIALRLDRDKLAANSVFYLVQNKYDNSDSNRPSQTSYDRGELGHRNKLARLIIELAPGARAYSIQNWTPFGFKAGGLTGMDLVHEESMKLTTMLLLDRNATVHDLDALMLDLKAAMDDPDVVIVIPGRGTTNTLTSVGQGSQMVEEGHRSFLKGLMGVLGGRASEAVGTGWGNILAVFYGRVQRALTDAHSPKMPLTSRMRRGSSFAVRAEGLIGFAPHAVGISEDTWAVSQTAHNAIALGHRVKFLVSRAIWHKIRETWSHSEWLASFPRWSGGYLQMMHDPIMQRVNDFGAVSVFAKEVRANSGRNFLSAPFALLNILFMPLAIMLDITPFIQILIVLWNFGFIMNQILTVHGLIAYLESSGFYRVPALAGVALAGVLSLSQPVLQPFAPGLIAGAFVAGGFFVGLSRWLYTRLRDMLLFGPQLVLHALGQVLRQTLEFTVSGASPQDARGVNMAFRAWAGPREDRPWEGYPQLINLKTVIWLVGLLSVILNLFALANLDMLNVLLLLPSLLFSASALLGPFLLSPRPGRPLGLWTFLPRALGWAAAFAFYIGVSVLIGQERAWKFLGVLFFAGLFALILRHGLRYLGYRRRWRALRHALGAMLPSDNERDARALADALMQSGGDAQRIAAMLERANVPASEREAIARLLLEQVAPLARTPLARARPHFISERFASEFSRSLALALLILIWFFVVPVPGVLVFTAGAYRFSMELGSVLQLVAWSVALIIASAWAGRFIQWLDRAGCGRSSLKSRLEKALRQIRESNITGLSPAQLAHACALLTDAQTYLDQRSLAYARQTLSRAEDILRR